MMDLEALRRDLENWRRRARAQATDRNELFATISGVPIDALYTPADVPDLDYARDLGFPGEYPFTRGIHYNMYRGRRWTMRQFSGFGTAEETNARYHFLLGHGQTGLSVAFDFPTLMGYDSDHPKSLGEVGRCGVAIDSLADMETLFRGIPLDKVSTSMTINGPACTLLALYIAAAEKQGVDSRVLRGTIQNDMLKEYMAQHAWCFPIQESLRVIVDMMEYCLENVPSWNTISISGYHIREAGSTAAQELAFTLANGFTYVEHGLARGLKVDDFATRLSFFWDVHLDFFEEIAKFRAARRIWAREMKERFKAQKRESLLLRTHAQTAGVSLTAQQPENNIVRTAIEALAAVLGGTQSLHTNSMDETWALPTDKAVQIALRTQQVIAHEHQVSETIDPLGGSYYVEQLTNRLEREAYDIFERIRKIGGVVRGVEDGWFQREIQASARRYQAEVDARKRIIVGVNEYVKADEKLEIPLLEIDPQLERQQVERVRKLRATRDRARAEKALERLKQAAAGNENVMPALVECARSYCTQGEMVGVMRGVFGEYHEPVFV
jgi:methylmalonyl-CoA mutase N-terminal domain/subunit